ncbi:MAG: hypothetical protein US54_C0047G0005 [Candidatus Roizmanbacteria bacterium GW2011_GWA2_37_7]|uniref:Glycosyltransferase RgtA/B/C/D-like domain-containing protein n=1 Tax=Candidatus Roizmanbacteria bacterium GW2011_GWA2_37_7 TaxID=1618481 RepID=A0A0G0H4D7_9BACT|nr:MAG: hypothetical protein US54_C0047G0005 [Candidatus Roizmanbacteria bacterium GW2011_GWA2_37_7]
MGKQTKRLVVGILFIFIVGVVLFINYYPHYYALLNTPANYSYSGQASWFDPWDINNYFAVIKLAQKEKKILLSNINTTERVKPAFVYPLYTTVAIIFPRVNNILLYHVLAIVCGILLASGIFVLSNLLLKKSFHSLYALLIISLGGGLGFLFSAPGISADLNIPGVTFFSTFQKPHEAIAAFLYISSLVFFFLSVDKKNIIFLLISIVSFLLLIPIYPYRLLSFFLIAGIFVLLSYMRVQKKYPFIYLGIFSALVFPLAIIYTLHFLSSGFSVLTSYQPNNISLISLLLGYGFFIVLFACQLFTPNNKTSLITFLNIWVLVSVGLAILPFGMSRLYLSGLLFPMAILFMLCLKDISKRSTILAFILMMFILILLLPTSLYTFHKRIVEVKNNNIWYYIPVQLKHGFDFLERSKQDGVLALSPLSSYIPAQTGKHVYFGIKDQTPDYDNKVNNAVLFYSGKLTENQAKAFLKENNIHFVIVSTQEEQVGKPSYPFLTVVYKNKGIEILKTTWAD